LAAGWALRAQSPLWATLAADVAATAVVFAFSVGFDNSSVYDPYWSLAPLPMTLYWALVGGPLDVRKLMVLALVFAWGIRLTVNWVERWRGLEDEDFRYVEIRAKTGRAYWPASFFSIHLMPTAWVFLGLVPVYPALLAPARAVGLLDAAAFVITAAAIVIEAVADRQLRRFMRSRQDPAAVLDAGLWAKSRHPNYFGEVIFWWGLYLFGLAAAPGWWWSVVGPLSITALFLFISGPWMDRRMLSRHPEFARRLEATSALVPWF
jgi:steroid 5-alpha reductase family enzyme